MSGGHYDYIYCRLQEIAIKHRKTSANRAAIQSLVTLFATLMHDVEWTDSGDSGADTEEKSLDALLAFAAALHETKNGAGFDLATVQSLRKKHLLSEQLEEEDSLIDPEP